MCNTMQCMQCEMQYKKLALQCKKCAMQCNAVQCNAMQRCAQCNVCSVGITAWLSPKGPKEGNSAAVKNAVKHQTFRLVSQNFSGGEKNRGGGALGNEWTHAKPSLAVCISVSKLCGINPGFLHVDQ